MLMDFIGIVVNWWRSGGGKNCHPLTLQLYSYYVRFCKLIFFTGYRLFHNPLRFLLNVLHISALEFTVLDVRCPSGSEIEPRNPK